MWRFQDFSVTLILCEIMLGRSGSSKNAFFAEAPNFFPGQFQQKKKKFIILKNQSIQMCLNDIFTTSNITTNFLISRKILVTDKY